MPKPHTPPVKDWEKEFDERFGVIEPGIIPFSEQFSADTFKDFIRILLKTQREEILREAITSVRRINTGCKCRYEGETVCCHEDCKECMTLKYVLSAIESLLQQDTNHE